MDEEESGTGITAQPTHEHLPGLDGMRALAVLSVLAYHGGVAGVGGGFLGVDVFFVLSGFLITTLLISEWRTTGMLRLGRFWGRRARRLLPAVFLLVLSVVVYADLFAPAGLYTHLRTDALSALFYVSNWWQIHTSANYFVQTAATSPLAHTWSLAIEEQFYLVWPVVVWIVLRRTKSLRLLLGVCLGGVLLSAAEMAFLYHRGTNLTRLYYGTDTHVQSLLVGAAAAVALAVMYGERDRGLVPRARSRSLTITLGGIGIVGFLSLGGMVHLLDGSSPFTYQGALLVAGLSSVAVISSVVVSRSGPVARLLELGPLRYIGRISYGVYLWHFPLFIWIDHQRTGLDGYALLTARVVATLAVSSASYRLVELPIMRGAAFRKKIAWLAASGAAGALTVVTVMFTATTATALVPATMPSAGATNAPDAGRTRVLIVGDSTAVTLSLGLSTTPDRYGVTEDSFTFLGCGVADGTEVFEHGVVFQVAAQCNLLTPASDQWPALWATRFNTFHPNVVAMLAGRWEVEDRLYDGRWTNILDRRFAAYVEQQLNLAAWIVRSAGARFVLFTAPYYSSGEQPDGSAWPEDDPRRVDAYNRILYQVAAADPEFVSVVDLKRLVCPGGKFVTSVDGVIVRAPDGIHLPYFSRSDPNDPSPDTYAQVRQFSAWIEPKLWPLITREEPLASRTSGPIRGTQRRRS